MRKERRIKTSTIRALVALGALVAIGSGLAVHSGVGTFSSFGVGYIASICPLGAIESMLGSRSFILHAALLLVIALAVIFVTGKAFCSWVCPVPRIQDVFKSRKQKEGEACDRRKRAERSLDRWRAGEAPGRGAKPRLDSRHAVLGGALASTAIFGFPVFCLVCPVGLSIATFVLVWRVFQYNELTWGLVVFPAIVILELFVLKRWCGKICPLGALMSLVSSKSRMLKPRVEEGLCLRNSKGSSCSACSAACPEGIDPFADLGDAPLSECVKCGGCADACPVRAISFPLFPKPGEATLRKKGEGE